MADGKKHVKPRFWILTSTIMLVAFAFAFAVQYVKLTSQAETVENLQNERAGLIQEVSELESRMDYMQTQDFIESEARAQLGMMYPGDVRYVPRGQ